MKQREREDRDKDGGVKGCSHRAKRGHSREALGITGGVRGNVPGRSNLFLATLAT